MSEAARDWFHPARSCPDNHVELDPRSIAWLADQGHTAEDVIAVERFRVDHAREFVAAIRATDEAEKILRVVTAYGPQTYDELSRFISSSRRTVRRRVSGLVEVGLLEADGKPTVVAFPGPKVAAVVGDALSIVDRSTGIEPKPQSKISEINSHRHLSKQTTSESSGVANRTSSGRIESGENS